MELAIFDLDHTLLHEDSDKSWNSYLVQIGVVDTAEYEAANQRWYQEYMNGTLDIREYNRWAFRLHRQYGSAQVTQWRDDYVEKIVPSMIASKTPSVLADHRARGHDILVITATSEFIAGPIIESLGIQDYLGLQNEIIDGEYTGELIGIPTFQAGKVDALKLWLENRGPYTAKHFYSDSINDLPLLEQVDYPVVVDGDEPLTAHGQAKGWPCVTFRD